MRQRSLKNNSVLDRFSHSLKNPDQMFPIPGYLLAVLVISECPNRHSIFQGTHIHIYAHASPIDLCQDNCGLCCHTAKDQMISKTHQKAARIEKGIHS